MSHTTKLRYGQLLLDLMRRHAAARNTACALAIADRWERLMASIPSDPLVWDGDYA